MYAILEQNRVLLWDKDENVLRKIISNIPQYRTKEIEEIPNGYVIYDGYMITETEAKEKEVQKEHERIQELSMTRSDFFDGTIKAFGADSEDLLKAIEYVLSGLEIAEVDKKVALNNYKNALNFYRKHPLFTMLADVEILLGSDQVTKSVTISSEQWDRFFDETDKKNPEAYKELLPIVETLEESEEEINIKEVENEETV